MEILFSSNIKAQTFSDSIFTKTDTIVGKITLVNNVNIFYDYKAGKKIKSTYIALADVLTYKKDTVNIDIISKIKFEDKFINNYSDVDKLILGAKIIMSADYPLFHGGFAFSLTKKQHNFHIGPEYLQFDEDNLQDDPLVKWDQNSFCLNVGYRFFPKSRFKNLHYYFGFNYSIFEVKFVEYHKMSPKTEENQFFFLNTGSMGVNYKVARKLNIYSGLGLSSNKFFLMFEPPFINLTFGLEYLFVK